MGHFGINGCNGRDSGDERNDWDVCEEAGEDGEMRDCVVGINGKLFLCCSTSSISVDVSRF